MLSKPTDNLALEAGLVPHFGPRMFIPSSLSWFRLAPLFCNREKQKQQAAKGIENIMYLKRSRTPDNCLSFPSQILLDIQAPKCCGIFLYAV